VAIDAAAETCEQARSPDAAIAQRDKREPSQREIAAGREAVMRYRLSSQWAVLGGAMLIPGGTVVDDQQWEFLKEVIPPPTAVPLDEPTRAWLIKSYQLPDHNHTIAPVEHSKQE
jgi:hypothetical protein